LIPKESVLCEEDAEKNLQWPPAAKGKKVCSAASCVWRFLHFVNEINTLLGIFGLKFLLQNIFQISSILLLSYKTVDDLGTKARKNKTKTLRV